MPPTPFFGGVDLQWMLHQGPLVEPKRYHFIHDERALLVAELSKEPPSVTLPSFCHLQVARVRASKRLAKIEGVGAEVILKRFAQR